MLDRLRCRCWRGTWIRFTHRSAKKKADPTPPMIAIMFDLINATAARGLVVLSGDVQMEAFYRFNRNTSYPL